MNSCHKDPSTNPSWFYKYNSAWTEGINNSIRNESCPVLIGTLLDLHRAADALKNDETLDSLISEGFWIFDVQSGSGLLSKIEHELIVGYFDDLIGYIYDGVDASKWVGEREFDTGRNRSAYECEDNSEWILRRDTWREGKGVSVAVPSSTIPSESVNLQNPGNSKNCGDFETYVDAKEWFDKYFVDFGDVAKLDSDGDGEPCESLPGGP